MEISGAYSADRAAALSGVPKSTLHYGARKEYLVPAVSAERVKLWSYADLLGLRVIYWLRQRKKVDGGVEIPPTRMSAVRQALSQLRKLDLTVFESGRPTVLVDRAGSVFLNVPSGPVHSAEGQGVLDDVIDLVAPFSSHEGGKGPDLSSPAEFIRILPRKLSGSPHIVDTRIETLALYALDRRGFSMDRISSLYPALERRAIDDALRIEHQLARNLHPLAA